MNRGGDAAGGEDSLATDAGAVNVLYGSSPGGLTASLDQFWHQDSPGVDGYAGVDDGFGRVPDHQRQVRIACVFGVREETGDDLPPLRGGRSLQRAGQIQTNERRAILTRELRELSNRWI